MDTEYTCDHISIINDTCQDCGLELEDNLVDYNVKNQFDDNYALLKAPRKEPFNYHDKLAQLNLPPKIAANVCEQISRLKERSHVRIGTHLKNLFVMIYIASTQEGAELNPSDIGEQLGMSPKTIREAVKIASVGIDGDGDRNPVCIISPFNFIREIASFFKDEYVVSEDSFSRIEEFIDLIMSHNKMIGNENPRGIAATVLKMFFDQNGIIVTDFLRKTKRTPGYIKIRENTIIKTLNSIEYV